MRPLLLVLALLAFPSTALAESWSGTWANDVVGTTGAARLTVDRGATLRLGGTAFGCAQPVVLDVRYRGGRVTGSGRNVPCNRGLRWSIAGGVDGATLHLRLPDGTDAQLRLALRERR